MNGALLTIDLWDVGQGDCSVIRLPNGRLIIIDVGPRGSPLVDWLNERRVPVEIEAVVLTHNDADHAGALTSIVSEHKRRIGAIWMLLDRNVRDSQFQKVFRAAVAGEEQGFYQISQLRSGQTLWMDRSSGTRIHVVYPSFSQNIQAANPNESSGVVVLEVEGERLLAWPGDLEFLKAARVLGSPGPHTLVGPHHGGPSDYPTKALRRSAPTGSLRDRMSELRKAADDLGLRRVFISVGTGNRYHHPRPGYIRLLSARGTRVVCSQLTNCCGREAVRGRQHVMTGSALLGLRAPRTGVSCRGAMRMFLKDGQLFADEFDQEHLRRVSGLLRPQCLRVGGWKRGDPLPDFLG